MPILTTPPISRTPPLSTQPLYTPTQSSINYTIQLWKNLGQPESLDVLIAELEKKGIPRGSAEVLANAVSSFRSRSAAAPKTAVNPKAESAAAVKEELSSRIARRKSPGQAIKEAADSTMIGKKPELPQKLSEFKEKLVQRGKSRVGTGSPFSISRSKRSTASGVTTAADATEEAESASVSAQTSGSTGTTTSQTTSTTASTGSSLPIEYLIFGQYIYNQNPDLYRDDWSTLRVALIKAGMDKDTATKVSGNWIAFRMGKYNEALKKAMATPAETGTKGWMDQTLNTETSVEKAKRFMDEAQAAVQAAEAAMAAAQEIINNPGSWEYRSHANGLPVPDGWERAPGYDNLIRRPKEELVQARKDYDQAVADYKSALAEYEMRKDKYEGALKRTHTEPATVPSPIITETQYEYNTLSAGLETPEGWERVPGYDNVIRRVVKEATPVLSDTERQAIDTGAKSRRDDILARIDDLDTQINELVGYKGEGDYYPNTNEIASHPEKDKLQQLVDERYALLQQLHAIGDYLAGTNDGEYVKDVDAGYLKFLKAYTDPNMVKHLTPEGGAKDIFAAMRDDKITDAQLKDAFGLSTKELGYLQEMAPYIRADGSVEIMKAIKSGKVRDDALKFVLRIDHAHYNDLRTVARYSDVNGAVNIAAMILDDFSQEDMRRLLGMQKAEYDAWQKLKPYIRRDGSVDLEGAVGASLDSPKDYPGWIITQADIQLIKDINYLKASGYMDDKGKLTSGVYVILRDEKARSSLQNVLGMTDEEFKAYMDLLPYIDFGYEYQPFPEDRKDIPEGWERDPNNLGQIRRQVVDGIDLDKLSDAYTNAYEYRSYSDGLPVPEGWERDPNYKNLIRRSLFPGFNISEQELKDFKEYKEAYNRLKAAGLFNSQGLIDGDALYDAVVNGKVSEHDLKMVVDISDAEIIAMKDLAAKDAAMKARETELINKGIVSWDGQLELAAGVAAGFTKPEDYPGWKVTQEDIDNVIKSNNALAWLEKIGAAEGGSYDLQKAFDELRNTNNFKTGEEDKLKEGLKLAFGDQVYDTEFRLWLTRQPVTIGAFGAGPPMTDEEYRRLIKPENISEKDYEKIAPYVTVKGGFDYVEALKNNAPVEAVVKMAGLDTQSLADAQWQAKYEQAGWLKQQTMALERAFQKDPLGTIKEMGLSAIPIYGTIRNWKDSPGWLNALSVVGEIAFFWTVAKGVSVAVKQGTDIGEAVLRGTVMAGRDTIIAPYTLVRHPIESIKVALSPIEHLINKARVPLAATFRGSYSKGMDITKVLAGQTKAEAMATRAGMEALIRQVNAGKANVKIPLEGYGSLRYQGSGLQAVMPQWMGTSTPFGAELKGLGVNVKNEGLYMSPEHYLNLSFQSATGKAPLYGFAGKELLGVIDETGHLINQSGKVIGRIAQGTKLLALDGKTLGTLSKDFKALDAAGNIIGEVKNGAVISKDTKLIARLYNGQPYIEGGKAIGTIDKNGVVIDKAGNIIKRALEMVVGYVPENAKRTNEMGRVIGIGKAQPAFALVYNQGVQELPKWVKEAGTIEEMEKRARELFNTGEYGNNLYPVFKQYAKWIELEGLLPKGTKLIPVVGGNGKPIILFTRDLAGRKIEIPLLQIVDHDWFEKSMAITRAINKENPLPEAMDLEKALKTVKNLPKKSVKELLAWLKKNKQARVLGSFSETVFTKGKIKANDIDIAVPEPKKVIDELTDIMRRGGVQARNDGKKVVEILNDKGIWVKAIDVDPLDWAVKEGLKTKVVQGINIQTPASQMNMLLKRMTDEFGGKGYARWYRYGRALGKDIDLGIGAKPPTFKDLMGLKARGAYNTIRDIFVQGLVKEDSIGKVAAIAPDLTNEARAAARMEEALIKARQAYRTAAAAAVSRGGRMPANLRQLAAHVQELEGQYSNARTRLEDRLMARAQILSPIAARLPKDKDEAERTYRELIERSAYSARVRRTASRAETDIARASDIKARTADRATERVLRKPTDVRIPRTERTVRAARETRTIREPRLVRELRAARAPTETREARAPREPREIRAPRQPRTVRETRIPRGDRVPREPRQPREERIIRMPRLPRQERPPIRTKYPRYQPYPPLPPKKTKLERTKQGNNSKKGPDIRRPVGPGDMFWRQGVFWIHLVPRVGGGYVAYYDKKAPPGAINNMRTPVETYFTRGGPEALPAKLKMDMGIMDVKITPTGYPKLKFKRG